MSNNILFKTRMSQWMIFPTALFFTIIFIVFFFMNPIFLPIVDGLIYSLMDDPIEESTVQILMNIFVFILLSSFVFWKYLVIKCTSYTFEKNRLIVGTGVFNKEFDYMEYYRVKDYSITRSFTERIFKLTSIEILSTDRTHPVLNLNALIDFEDKEEIFRNAIEDSASEGRGREVDVV